MVKENYKWNYDYVRLAGDTEFAFERHKSEDFDKNKICLIDIDRVVKEKDVSTIEKFIPSVIQFVLDPEQAQILDESFVKTFQVAQLAIEYLLFCKKYLDKTVVLIKEQITKVKEENKELNLFVEELKRHVSALMKEIKDKSAVFKCEQCNKVFSSDEFLNSHLKRRHSNQMNQPPEAETDKLHSEIKELKGRLNSAEKLIQRETTQLQPIKDADEAKKIDDLQQKFEDLRVQVQSELKLLQTQHNFQDKYEKWFEKMAFQYAKPGINKDGAGDLGQRRESTTQTDLGVNVQEVQIIKSDNNKENVGDINTQRQIAEFGEALETKVTSSLEKIESQMRSFCNKLNEMEIYKRSYDQGSELAPPAVKPRSKYTTKNPPLRGDEELEETVEYKTTPSPKGASFKNKKPLRTVHKETSPQPVKVVETRPQMSSLRDDNAISIATSSELSSSETEITAESPREEPVKLPPPKPVPVSGKRSVASTKKIKLDEEVLSHFKHVVETIIIGRLQDLGVSPDWQGLPLRSFHKALEIVNHQAKLMKKTYPNFDFISAQIEKNIAAKLEEANPKIKRVKEKSKKVQGKIISKKGRVPSPKIEIKNRKMYETDSESDVVKPTKVKENFKQFSAPYSAVIEELKTVTAKIDADDKSDVNSDNVKIEDQTKGVLKNYPSVGSLTKKKVLFNLESDRKMGGSTTTIASSVLDGSPRKITENKKEKDIEDLSDFDFSDM